MSNLADRPVRVLHFTSLSLSPSLALTPRPLRILPPPPMLPVCRPSHFRGAASPCACAPLLERVLSCPLLWLPLSIFPPTSELRYTELVSPEHICMRERDAACDDPPEGGLRTGWLLRPASCACCCTHTTTTLTFSLSLSLSTAPVCPAHRHVYGPVFSDTYSECTVYSGGCNALQYYKRDGKQQQQQQAGFLPSRIAPLRGSRQEEERCWRRQVLLLLHWLTRLCAGTVSSRSRRA